MDSKYLKINKIQFYKGIALLEYLMFYYLTHSKLDNH